MTLSMDEYAHRLQQWRDETRATWALLAGGGETYLLERALTPMASPKHYARWLVRMAQSGKGRDYLITADWLLTEYEGQLREMFAATRPAAEALGIESPSVAAVGVPAPSAPGTEAGEQCAAEGPEGAGDSPLAPSTSWKCGVVGPNGFDGEGALVCDRHEGHGGGHEETVGGLTYGWFDAARAYLGEAP